MHWPLYDAVRSIFAPRSQIAGPRYWEASGPPYCISDPSRELRQGEIITQLKYHTVLENQKDVQKLDLYTEEFSYAIILSPECDLLQDFKSNHSSVEKCLNVLFLPMEEADVARKRWKKNSAEWRPMAANQWSQFYYLSGLSAEFDALGQSLPNLLVDFKRYFTLPSVEIYRQCRQSGTAKASRRCRLNDMWREDFRHRALSYMGRIGVPDEADNR
jgi:hypothetical protein